MKRNFLTGETLSSDDADALTQMQGANQLPSAEKHPNLYAWYSFVSKFTPAIRETWKGTKKADVAPKAAKKHDKKKEDEKK